MHFPGVSLITGAASGIGRATAKLLAREGCRRIAIADIDFKSLQETKKQILDAHKGLQVLAVETDVSTEESVVSMISEIKTCFGRLDYACNVAGIVVPGQSIDVSAQQWDQQMQVNARGMWLCQRAEISQMLKQEPLKADDSLFTARGAIANVSSTLGLRGLDSLPLYCASKHAIIGFTKADGLQYAKDKIRINAVCPGVISTPMMGVSVESIESSIQIEGSDIAMKRYGRPEEVAECLAWLVSGRASYVTATTLIPSGGTSI